MTSAAYDITVEQGVDYKFIVDPPSTISFTSAKLQVRDKKDTLIFEVSTTNSYIVYTSGKLYIHFPVSDTILLTTAEYVYDLLVFGTETSKLIRGKVKVIPLVTKA